MGIEFQISVILAAAGWIIAILNWVAYSNTVNELNACINDINTELGYGQDPEDPEDD